MNYVFIKFRDNNKLLPWEFIGLLLLVLLVMKTYFCGLKDRSDMKKNKCSKINFTMIYSGSSFQTRVLQSPHT